MVEIQPGFGIRAPGVLHLQQQMAKQRNIGCIAGSKFALGQPGLAQPATSRYRATLSGSLATPWIQVSPISSVTTGSEPR